MTTGSRVLRGSLLSYGSFLTSKALTLVATVLLARLLAPADFGLVGYALLVLGFLYVLKNLGLGTALIYRQDLSHDDAGEIFVVAVAAALLFCGVAWVLAPVVAEFFADPRITPVVRVLGFTFLVNALGDVHNAQLQKRLHFGRRFAPGLVLSAVKGPVAIILAVAGLGYWSLVWGQLAGDAVSTAMSWFLFPWIPRMRLRWSSVRMLLNYGVQIAVLELIGLVLLNSDNVVIGRMLGGAALGMYALAFTIPQMLTISLSSAVSQAVFPAFATIQRDVPMLRSGYLTVLRNTALVLVPIGVGLCATTPTLIHVLFTPAWWPMIPVVQILAIYAMVYSVGWSASDIYMAIGRPDLQWKLDAVHAIILVPALIVGAYLGGITGVAVCQLGVVVPYCVVRYWLIGRTLGLRYNDILAAVRVPVLGGAIACATCGLVAHLAEPGAAAIATLLVQVVLGATAYALFLLIYHPEARGYLRECRRAFRLQEAG